MSAQAFATPVFDPGGINGVKTVSRVKITQTEFLHDMAVITLRGADMSAPELQPGTPVQITYGWQNVQNIGFYGYIDHIESSYARMEPLEVRYNDVICLGASYVLKDPITGTWTSVRASDLAQQIAGRYYLSVFVEIGDTLWPQIGTPGTSAWSFLVSLAQKLGYTLACNQTLLRFTSVDAALAQSWNSMPIFRNQVSAPSLSYQTLQRFKAIQGESLNLPGHSRATRTAGGINPLTGQVITVTDNASAVSAMGKSVPYPFFTQSQTDLVVNDQFQGQASLAGLQQQNRFHYLAEATLSGDASVVQGMPIVLTGLDAKDNGVWWVQEVTHEIKVNSYIMMVQLGRDSSGDSGARPVTSKAVAFDEGDPFAYALANIPPTTLVNNRWRSAYQSNTQVA